MSAVGREQSILLNVTVSSGSGTGTFANMWAIARRIRIIPPSESTTYDCMIKDADGDLIFDSTDGISPTTGTLSMLNEMSLGIMKTISIVNASGDGTWKIKLDMH